MFKVLNDECDSMPTNWNRRYKYNLEKIKTGSIYQIAEVFRDLTNLSRERDLSFGEKKMLDDIRRVIVAEIANAKNVLSDSAETILDEQVRIALQ
jgi:CarD family transcriptional regulator